VYTSFQLAKKYLHYYLTAHNGKGHGMHSPFVFDFILRVINNRNRYTPPAAIENIRQQLLKNSNLIEIEDMGAGSRVSASKTKSVQQIARTAVKPKKWSQFLFRLVKHYQPQNIIELGTSLGISTAYMAAANEAAQVYTIEGSQAIQQIAQQHFRQLGFLNIHSLQGNFDDQLLPFPYRPGVY
jgi:predicted O-methyltransferase YrrM